MSKQIKVGVLAVASLAAAVLFYIMVVVEDEGPSEPSFSSNNFSDDASDTQNIDWNNTGTWVTQQGSSEAGYRIKWLQMEEAGRTQNVSGEINIANAQLETGIFTIDVATISTGKPDRDKDFQELLDIENFPEATFKLNEPISITTDQESIDTVASGDLTLNGISQQIEIPIQGQVNNDGLLEIISIFEIELSEFNIDTPSKFGVDAAEQAFIEVQFTFVRV